MKELVIISGKGGTGKTSLMAAFAALAKDRVLCDTDVDAADLHLLANPRVLQRTVFTSGHTARIDPDLCLECGLCRDLCRWNCIGDTFQIDPIGCEGCGVCVHFCPQNAIEFPENTCGEWMVSDTRFGPMLHARLGIAEENSGKLVTLVRREARKLAEDKKLELIITDGPPGVGCPVIAAIGGADAVVIVTEPTVAGLHDMKRVADLADHFKVPVMICINKYDLNPDMTREIENFAQKRHSPCLGHIPFDPMFTEAMIQAQTVIEYGNGSPVNTNIKAIWKRIEDRLGLL
ncbi:MAG: P-loop NTPase [Desulfobacterales bacterium]|nr:P-loop NTPase [Desulfobacterales bacterium]